MKQLLAAGLVPAALGFAQLDRGQIAGTVTDPSGAVVPGVRITVRNAATGAVYETESNENGQYVRPNLPSGPYVVSAEKQGLKRLERSGIMLKPTEIFRVDLTMEIGSTTESVQVTAAIPRIQSDNPETGTTLDNKQMVDLPFSFSGGRLMENLAHKVAAGVNGNRWQNTSNGLPFFSKDVLLDGASVSSWAPGIFVLTAVSMEAVGEFKMQTSGMSAEYGRSAGGIYNYVMKSGTNEIHGSAYGSIRNEALNANLWSNNARGVRRPLDRKHNYSFSFGSPVTIPKLYDGRNRTFFYAAYENYRDRNLIFASPNRSVPLPEFYDGDFSRLLGAATGQTDALGRAVPRGAIYDPATFRQLDGGRWVGDMFPGNRMPLVRFSEASKRLIAIARDGYLPTVRDPVTGLFALQNNSYAPSNVIPITDDRFISVKGDQIISNAHKLSAVWTMDDQGRTLANQGGVFNAAAGVIGGPLASVILERVRGQNSRISHDWTASPRVLNHLTLFWTRNSRPEKTAQNATNGGQTLGIPNLTTIGFPRINWGLGPFVTQDPAGFPFAQNTTADSYGLLNTFSFSRGRHFMKSGFDYRITRRIRVQTQGGQFDFSPLATAIPREAFSGSLTGYSFASFLLGIVHQGQLIDPVSLGQHRHYYALFFQDDFKVNRRLTLNLGLRWEYQPPFFESADRLSSWNPTKTDPATGLPGAYDFAGDCQGCTGKRTFGRTSRRDFGPRLGFAYQVTPKWTIRGAYGIMYAPDIAGGPGTPGTPLGTATNLHATGTWTLDPDPNQPWNGIFRWDNGLPQSRFRAATRDASWGNRNRPGMFDPGYGQTAYIQNWNFNLQRQLPGGFLVDLGYIGNKSTGLRIGELANVNQLPSEALSRFGRALANPVRNPEEAAANGIRYPFPGFSGSVASALRPYPQVQGNSTVAVYGSPLGFSNYHSLNLIVNKELSNGLTVYSNWVYSKAIGNMRSLNTADNPNRPIDYYNLRREKTVLDYDRTHFTKIFVIYELPFGKGKALGTGTSGVWNTLIAGWSIAPILQYASGTPLTFVTNTSPLPGFWNGTVNRADLRSGDPRNASFSKDAFSITNVSGPGNTYLNKSAFADPAPLTLGNSSYALSRGRDIGIISEDISLQKNFYVSEKYRIQFRGDLLNAFNRHYVGAVVTNPTSPLFGQVTAIGGRENTEASRTIQFSLRLDF
jgi:hypothetical protein